MVKVFIVGTLLFSTGCQTPVNIPGEGDFLKVDLSERQDGTASFSRTKLRAKPADKEILTEMECEFSDGTKIREPCASAMTLECPIVEAPPPGPETVTASRNYTFDQLVSATRPHKAPPKITRGVYVPAKPVEGGECHYTATFQTRLLPVSFKLWNRGKAGPVIKIKLESHRRWQRTWRVGRLLSRSTAYGLDAVDGTPVLDLKPHMKGFEPRGEVREPAWAAELMGKYW